MVRNNAALCSALFFLLAGCGGSGVKGADPIRDDTFTVGANEQTSRTFDNWTISIRAGGFRNGAELNAKQFDQNSPPFRPPTPSLALAYTALELSASTVADQPIDLSVPDINGQVPIVSLEKNGEWVKLQSTLNNNQLRFELPSEGGSQPQAGVTWKVVVGWAKDNAPDLDLGIYRVAGTGPLGPGSTIITHGLMDNYQSMTAFAEYWQQITGCTNVYSVAYPWTIDADIVADYLGSVLDSLAVNPKSIVLIGYSRGSLINYYVLEKLGKTKAVSDAVFVAGPRLGSKAAVKADLLFDLAKAWLESFFPCPPWWDIDDPALSEMIPGSDFLRELNTPPNQRGEVNYYLFAGDRDAVVSVDSALAKGLSLEAFTAGGINPHLINGGSHGSLKSNRSQIEQMANLFKAFQASNLVFELIPNPVNGQQDGWWWLLRITNRGQTAAFLNALSLENYDRPGVWFGRQWYDPNTPDGDFFPIDYRPWNVWLQPNVTVELPLHLWPNFNRDPLDTVPIDRQAGSSIFTLYATVNSKQVVTKSVLTRHYNDIWPEPPQTRSPHGPNTGLIERVSK